MFRLATWSLMIALAAAVLLTGGTVAWAEDRFLNSGPAFAQMEAGTEEEPLLSASSRHLTTGQREYARPKLKQGDPRGDDHRFYSHKGAHRFHKPHQSHDRYGYYDPYPNAHRRYGSPHRGYKGYLGLSACFRSGSVYVCLHDLHRSYRGGLHLRFGH
ncbi:MAG: hypothetical protein C0617_09135 [Desulfuromonas sp.]|uniref:hypothetical protein n=1 Tax=Desulfuromonas sp. TaxID=892 RepID=UPI000CB513C0|nr:hypothetical protein [Desulfuromonas sp.]PLX84227.1 MAG: hypothetical protein C0617_09135 [Desulfuromonas sp.]